MSRYHTVECLICHCRGDGPKRVEHHRNKESVCLKCLSIITKYSPEVAVGLDFPRKDRCELCSQDNTICFNVTSCGGHFKPDEDDYVKPTTNTTSPASTADATIKHP